VIRFPFRHSPTSILIPRNVEGPFDDPMHATPGDLDLNLRRHRPLFDSGGIIPQVDGGGNPWWIGPRSIRSVRHGDGGVGGLRRFGFREPTRHAHLAAQELAERDALHYRTTAAGERSPPKH